MACLTEHVLGLHSCRRFKGWWLRFDVIQDLLFTSTHRGLGLFRCLAGLSLTLSLGMLGHAESEVKSCDDSKSATFLSVRSLMYFAVRILLPCDEGILSVGLL